MSLAVVRRIIFSTVLSNWRTMSISGFIVARTGYLWCRLPLADQQIGISETAAVFCAAVLVLVLESRKAIVYLAHPWWSAIKMRHKNIFSTSQAISNVESPGPPSQAFATRTSSGWSPTDSGWNWAAISAALTYPAPWPHETRMEVLLVLRPIMRGQYRSSEAIASMSNPCDGVPLWFP